MDDPISLFMGVVVVLVVGAICLSVVLWIAFAIIDRCTPIRQYRSPEEECGPQCPWCGYNLRGNTSGRCPECGTKRMGLRRTIDSPPA